MSKSKNPSYIEERLRRTALRKMKRKAARKEKYRRYGRGRATCPYCGGQMTWCSGCEMWSRTCCEEYGTCQCS